MLDVLLLFREKGNNDWNDDNDVGSSHVSESKERRGSRPRLALRDSRARRAARAIMRPAPSSSRGAASALAGAPPERRRGSRASPPPSPPCEGPSSPAFEDSARSLALRRETAPASVRAAIASDLDEVACALEEERAQRACETREDAAASASTLASLSQLRAVLVEV